MSTVSHSEVNPYRRGADAGFVFGLYLSVMYAASVYSSVVPLLGLVSMGMFVAVPVIVYKFLRRTFVAEGGRTFVSSLWMQGIVMFLCGGLIYSFVVALYCRWINPTYLADQIVAVRDTFSAIDDARAAEMASTANAMLDRGAVPTATSWAMAVFWLTVLTGSLLSGLMAVVVRLRGVKRR